MSVFAIVYIVLEGLANYFESMDTDQFGNDDRAARIIRTAITELRIFEQEQKANKS